MILIRIAWSVLLSLTKTSHRSRAIFHSFIKLWFSSSHLRQDERWEREMCVLLLSDWKLMKHKSSSSLCATDDANAASLFQRRRRKSYDSLAKNSQPIILSSSSLSIVFDASSYIWSAVSIDWSEVTDWICKNKRRKMEIAHFTDAGAVIVSLKRKGCVRMFSWISFNFLLHQHRSRSLFAHIAKWFELAIFISASRSSPSSREPKHRVSVCIVFHLRNSRFTFRDWK